jgi:hypothetical protein
MHGQERFGAMGGLTQRGGSKIYFIAAADFLPAQIISPVGSSELVSNSSIKPTCQHTGTAKYSSISNAFAIAPLPTNLAIDIPTWTSWLDLNGLTPTEDLLGSRVYLGNGDRGEFGEVSIVNSTLWLATSGEEPLGFCGTAELKVRSSESLFVAASSIGAPVFDEHGRLAAFIAASDSKTCVLAPAETIFKEYGLNFPTLNCLQEHNFGIVEKPKADRYRAPEGNFSAFGKKVASSSPNYTRAAG